MDCKRVTSSKCCPAKIDKLAHLDFQFKSAAQSLRNEYVESDLCACVWSLDYRSNVRDVLPGANLCGDPNIRKNVRNKQ